MGALIIIGTFCTMEFVAWFTHKYVMHGLLWSLHKDHHKKEHDSVMEWNDFFFIIFAAPAIVFIYLGVAEGQTLLLWIGLGITLYGMAYFFIHDIFIHQRVKWFRKADSNYFKAIRRAHKIHHKHLGKEDGECFGMLLAPLKYFRDARKTLSS